jgi:predicted nucleotidyltransferase component of viral defense system
MRNNALNQIINEQKPNTIEDYKKVLREILQKICLLGLWRGGFFEHATFYGGTALGMLYGLDRFSEDLDFSLIEPKSDFELNSYLSFVQKELSAWGIAADVSISDKTDSKIESAFIKTNTIKALLELSIPKNKVTSLHRDEVSKVKFELDSQPPCPFSYEFKYILEPIPFSVGVMSLPDLFAGKMHAVLARSWQNRVKGRDWYDFIWFVRNKIPLRLTHLEKRLQQSGHLSPGFQLSVSHFRKLLEERIHFVDFSQAKQDVLPFIANSASVENWSKELFLQLAKMVVCKE